MRFTLLITVSLVALGGCKTLDVRKNATPVVAEVPAPPQAKWVAAAPEDLPATDWVGTFNSNVLPALVSEALSANTTIKVAEARFDAAVARANIADANKLPTVTANVRGSRTVASNNGLPDFTNLSLALNASWEPDLWGRIRDNANSSAFDATALQADYAAAKLSVAGQVAQTWFDLIEAGLLSELSVREVETQERALRLTTRRFEGGVTGSSDVRLARSSLASAEALQATRAQRESALARNLEVLLRRYPSEAILANKDLPDLPPLKGTNTPEDMLRRRPDVLAAEHRMRSAGLQVDVARKALLPSLTLNGDITSGDSKFLKIFDANSLGESISASIVQPIFNAGRLKADVEQQKAVLRQQLESYAGTALNAYLEVENALDAENRLEQREVALRVSLEEAVQAEDRLSLRYSEGLATILQLLDAQSRRISAESQLISARKERLANRVRLHVALGGGLETQEVIQVASRG